MLEIIFDSTVDLLEAVSEKTGIGYKELNVIGLFAVIGIITALSVKAFTKK